MQQYFENRESIKIEEITSNKVYENIILANERIDKKWNSKNYIINNSTFATTRWGRKYNNLCHKYMLIGCFTSQSQNRVECHALHYV